MICSTHRGLEVAQHHIEPAEGLDLLAPVAHENSLIDKPF